MSSVLIDELEGLSQPEREKWLLEHRDLIEKDRRFYCFCKTCRRVFLDISCSEYLEKHDWSGKPDRWFVETGIHWCECEGHSIVLEWHDREYVQDISQVWENKLILDRETDPDATRELMYPFFLKYREECRGKPI